MEFTNAANVLGDTVSFESLNSCMLPESNNISSILEYNSKSLDAILNSNQMVEVQFRLLKEEVSRVLKENTRLESEAADLKIQVHELQQISSKRCLEFIGLSEKKTMNMDQIGKNVMQYLNIDGGQDVSSIHQVQTEKEDGLKYVIIEFLPKTTQENSLHTADGNVRLSTETMLLKMVQRLHTTIDKLNEDKWDLHKRNDIQRKELAIAKLNERVKKWSNSRGNGLKKSNEMRKAKDDNIEEEENDEEKNKGNIKEPIVGDSVDTIQWVGETNHANSSNRYIPPQLRFKKQYVPSNEDEAVKYEV